MRLGQGGEMGPLLGTLLIVGFSGFLVSGEITIFKDGKKETTTLTEALEILQQAEIKQLKEKIAKLKLETQEMKTQHEQEIKNLDLERETSEADITEQIKQAKATTKKQDILIDFMKDMVHIDDGELKSCMVNVKNQDAGIYALSSMRIKFQKENELNLKKSFQKVELLKLFEDEKTALKNNFTAQISEAQPEILNPDIENDHNFPQFAKFLTKTLMDQASILQKFSDQLQEEDQVRKTMNVIVKELEGLKFSFTSDSSHWEMLNKYQDIFTQQALNLEEIEPTVAAVIDAGVGTFSYELSPEGKLLDEAPCQCLPNLPGSGVTPSSLSMTCPPGTVSLSSLQSSLKLSCPGGACPAEVMDTQCGDFNETPWSEWMQCSAPLGSECLIDLLRTRKVKDASGNITSDADLQGAGSGPMIFYSDLVWESRDRGNFSNTVLSEIPPSNNHLLKYDLMPGLRLGIFLVGGGGGADDSYSGSSGFFKYDEITVEAKGTYTFNLNIGYGGDYNNGGSTDLVIFQDDLGPSGVLYRNSAAGGGKARGNGWSGGSSEKGGWNGSNGQDEYNGSGEQLPSLCSPEVSLTPGQTGAYDSDGTGGGGVIINGLKPITRFRKDGEGFGAGGGENNFDGYAGAAVIMVCY